MDTKILGIGKDGLVLSPPINCELENHINLQDFVGKIYIKQKKPHEVKERIDNLPDELDGELYYKENYLCSVTIPEEISVKITSSTLNRLSSNQLILKKVDGENLSNQLYKILHEIDENDGCKMFDLFKASIECYFLIGELVEKNIYYNDFSTVNIIYNDKIKKLILIDLDDISYGNPRAFDKRILYNEKTKTYNPNFYYEDKYGYAFWYIMYIDNIIIPILGVILEAYSMEDDEYFLEKFDEETKSAFLKRKEYFENLIGKPYRDINNTDIEIINNNLDKIQEQFCQKIGGKKSKSRKTNKKVNTNKKVKINKRRKTNKNRQRCK